MLRAATHTCMVLVLLCAAAGDASASVKQAKKHFHRAETHYRLGRFEDALAEYSKAYEEKELPAFLFNIAQCHMELGNYERAVFFYEGFLLERPSDPNRALVEARLADAKKALARAEEETRLQEEAERERLAEEIRVADDKARAAEEARAAEAARARAVTLELERRKAAEAQEPAAYETWWFWTAIGSVVVAVAAGTVIAMSGGETKTVLPSGDIGTIDGR